MQMRRGAAVRIIKAEFHDVFRFDALFKKGKSFNLMELCLSTVP